jgi:hypothetical protein
VKYLLARVKVNVRHAGPQLATTLQCHGFWGLGWSNSSTLAMISQNRRMKGEYAANANWRSWGLLFEFFREYQSNEGISMESEGNLVNQSEHVW